MKTVLPSQLKEMLMDGEELAVIDVREQGDFSEAQILLSCCIPFSQLELKIADAVPRYQTRMVLLDHGPSDPMMPAIRAAERLLGFGYTDVAVLDGGIGGWRSSGYGVYSGVNVLSKAFGEYVEETCNTPRVSAGGLKAKIDGREPVIILDARPKEEYHRMSIPGAVNLPGAELVHRFFDMVPDAKTPVVVNCAGRTRSIIGAQSLINAGVENPVAALENGTMGWHLAGFELDCHRKTGLVRPSASSLEKARAAAARVGKRVGVRQVDDATLEAWRSDAWKSDAWRKQSGQRTLYILDVRLPEEFDSGHLQGARNAPGGQLVQATDEFAAVRNARIVLVDDDGIRATLTASWLMQMGWIDVFVLSGGIGNRNLVRGPHTPEIPGYRPREVISPAELSAETLSGSKVFVIDFASSRQYRKAHVPGANWFTRARLPADLEATRPGISVQVIKGGTHAWMESGLPVESGMTRACAPVNDVWYKPYEHEDAPEAAMRDYLSWEIALADRIKGDDTVAFRTFRV